jgi:two-component system response regulator FixJ
MRELIHIIDDDSLARASISYMLTNHGYCTEIYASGGEFFRDCRAERGCILLDVCMPQMNGHDVLEELGRRGNPLPVVVMTGYRYLPGVVRAMRLGAIDFVEKPLSEETLLATVSLALASLGKWNVRRNVAAAAAERLKILTPREQQTLQGLFDGLSSVGIAHRMGVSVRTAEMHRAHMNHKLGISCLSDVMKLAIEAELTPIQKPVKPESAQAGGLLGA